ncbi:MAG: hypothetical protein KC416_15320 [Myxococcales bacterium]|nr:hypothetical protein [Myxococcales bacterium]
MADLVITSVGHDRPGIVHRITGIVAQHGGNLADSRMVNLRGRFAVLVLAEVPDGKGPAITEALAALDREFGLRTTLFEAPPSSTGAVGVPYRLKTFAMDQPGIVHAVTDYLSKKGINVEELSTHAEPRPESGAPIFSMDMRITVPGTLKIQGLRAELEELCAGLNCDVELIGMG